MNTACKIKEGIWINNEGLKRKVWISIEENSSQIQRRNSLLTDKDNKIKLFSVWFKLGFNTNAIQFGCYESIHIAESEIEKIVNQKIQWRFV